MLEEPRITRERGGTWLISAHARVKPKRDWRFMGIVSLIASALFLLYNAGSWDTATSLMEFFPALSLALLGAILISVSERPKLVHTPLLRIWPSEEPSEPPRVTRFEHGHPIALDTEVLSDVVYGLIDYPLPEQPRIHVEAFAIYLAQEDGTPIPVIEATQDKLAAHRVAKRLADLLSIPLQQHGKGR